MITAKVVSSLPEARNTLTQRPFAKYDWTIPTTVVTKLDVSHMKEGDIAGLAVFQDPYAFIAVKRSNDSWYITMVNNGTTIDSVKIHKPTVYLRTAASDDPGKASFAYSLDNKLFTPLGDELQMLFNLKIFTGNKFCIFNYATKHEGGYVDFDWFRVH